MDNSRRKFIKIAGIAAAVGMGSGFGLKVSASYEPKVKSYKELPEAIHRKR